MLISPFSTVLTCPLITFNLRELLADDELIEKKEAEVVEGAKDEFLA